MDYAPGKDLTGAAALLSINGYDDRYSKKIVDGVEIAESVTNWSMLNSYPQEMVDQIEVIKGGFSSVWGANMAGIINAEYRSGGLGLHAGARYDYDSSFGS